MSEPFRGTALPLDQEGLAEVIDRMRVGAAELWAVLDIETRGCGFLPDRRPVILFERHIFSRETNHRFDTPHPHISNRQRGGYGADGAHQYERDRKSTRLNSSHVSISYAVFCLKKK